MDENMRGLAEEKAGAAQAGEKQAEQLEAGQSAQVEAVGAVMTGESTPPPGKIKVDLHCHSEASSDCSSPLAGILRRCVEQKVRIQAITDHNEIWGAQKMQEMALERAEDGLPSVTVIVGEEVSTVEGEIIGLFLKERIPQGLSPEETVERIKGQGGLVLLPHGFDPMKRWRLKPGALQRIAKEIDIVETFNARISRPRWNQAAVAWCELNGVLMSAGTDAHTLADIGMAWVEAPAQHILGPADLLRALEGGLPVGVWTHPVVAFLYKMYDRTKRKLGLSR